MHFLTDEESAAWCEGWVEMAPSDVPVPLYRHPPYARVPLQAETAFCRQLEQALQPRDELLLWVTSWGVWRSSENLHLYYRLRQSYGDPRRLQDAPGHLFHPHEAADLVSFLQVGILCGWDMHLISSEGYARLFVSHDEFADFAANEANPYLLGEFVAAHADARIVRPG